MEPFSGRGGIVVLLTVTLVVLQQAHGITEADLFPFGPSVTGLLPRGDDTSFTFAFVPPGSLTFRGEVVASITVRTDGVVDLNPAMGSILGFSADVDTRAIGDVTYRLVSDFLGPLEPFIDAVSSFDNRFMGTYNRVFSATYDTVGYFDQNIDPMNTFQINIVYNSNEDETLVILLYPEDQINWTTGDRDGGTFGVGGNPAEVGLDSPQESLRIEPSGSNEIINIETLSNIEIPGVFIFKVDTEFLEPNSSFGVPRIPSGSGDSGSMPELLFGCVEAGFNTSCCEPSVDQTCEIGGSSGFATCSCDAGCFANGNCCDDILDVPCLPDIIVEFVPQQYTVTEDGDYVVVTVRATGFPEAPFDMVDNITVMLFTVDGSALGGSTPADGSDYTGTIRDLMFSSDGEWDVSIQIVDDMLVELSPEFFLVSISSPSQFVVFNNSQATVDIIDNDRLVVSFELSEYTVREAMGSVEVCVHVESGVLQSGIEAVVTVEATALQQEVIGDFGAGTFELTFDSGGESQCLSISIVNDNLIENNEIFGVLVVIDGDSNPMVFPGSIPFASVTIIDTTAPIGIEQATYEVGERDGSLEVCVVANGSLSQDVEVFLLSQDGTANFGLDYQPLSENLTLMAGLSPRVCVNLVIEEDEIDEAAETVILRIANNNDWPEFRDMSTVTIVDNDVVRIGLSQTEYTVTENIDPIAIVCAILDRTLQRDGVRVRFSTRNGDAESGSDYSMLSEIVTFNSDDDQMCVNITILTDSLLEPQESFFVDLTSITGELIFSTPAEVTIIDDDEDQVSVSFENGAFTVTETDTSQILNVCVLATPLERDGIDVTVRSFMFTNGAVESEDYSLVDEVITFNSGDSTQCIDVTILGDLVIENTESFFLSLSSTDADIGSPPATIISIIDDDEPEGDLVFDQPNYQVGEGDGPLTFCIIATGPLSVDTTVSVFTQTTSPPSASPPGDYTTLPTTMLVFGPGRSTSQCVDINIVDDNIDEGPESFLLVCVYERSTGDGMTETVTVTANVIIIDNDFVRIGLSPTQYTVTENVDPIARVCAILDRALQRDGVRVRFSTRNGDAESGSDYSILSEIVTFNSGDQQMCVDITILTDFLLEPQESFFVDLTSITGELIFSTPAEVTIIDDDEEGDLVFDQPNYQVGEGDGPLTFCIIATGPLSVDTTVSVFTQTTSPPSASPPGDYTTLPTTMLVFGPGRSTSQCVDINIVDDNIDEGPESFLLVCVYERSTGDGMTETVTVTANVIIIDNDFVRVGLSPTQYTVTENVDPIARVCAILDRALQRDGVRVRFSTRNGDAESGSDYSMLSEIVTFNSGDQQMCVDITILTDFLLEPQESFFVDLTSITGELIFSTPAEVTIIDDDEEGDLVFDQPFYQVGEGDGPLTFCIIATGPLSVETTVSVFTQTTSPPSAIPPGDYTTLPTTMLVFGPGRSTSQCVDINIVDDNIDEGPESFLLVCVYERSTGDGMTETVTVTANVTIIDNDQVSVSFENAAITVTETDTSQILNVCVLATPLERDGIDVTVRSFMFTNDAVESEDYSLVDEVITFNSGDSSQCIDVTILGDLVIENTESFFLSLSSTDADIGSPPATIISIIDDEPEGDLVFDQPNYQVGEGDGPLTFCIIATGPLSVETTVSVFTQTTSPPSASPPGDYTTLPTTMLVFGPGRSTSQCVDINIVDDNIDEGPESFLLVCVYERSTGDGMTETVTVTANVIIIDNDFVRIGLSPTQYTVTENVDPIARVCAILDRALQRDGVRVRFSTRNGDAESGSDYSILSEIVTFNSGDQQMCVDITILTDFLLEPQESFFVDLTSITGELIFSTPAEVTIIDDDEEGDLVFDQPNYQVREGDGPLTFCIIATGPLSVDTTVSVFTQTTSPPSASPPGDYTTLPTTMLVFGPGRSTSQCVDINIVDDNIDEGPESFLLVCVYERSTGDGMTETVTVTANVIIIDNDVVRVGLSPTQYTVTENVDPIARVCSILDRALQRDGVRVRFSTRNGDAESGSDYSMLSEIVTFNSGDQQMCVDITILTDFLLEPQESFFVDLTSITGELIFSTPAEVTIIDDDEGTDVQIGFELSAYTVEEEDEAVQICVSVNQAFSGTVTATVSTIDQSAQAGSDYVTQTTSLTFSAGDLRECVEIDLIDDGVAEPGESFALTLQTNSLPVFRSVATVFIQGGDGRLDVTLTEAVVAVDEGRVELPVCVDFLGSVLTRQVVVTLTTLTGSAQENVDYTGESTEITYFPRITEVIICENVTITNDAIEEEIEIFGVTLTSSDPAVMFLISFGSIIIVDNDEMDLSAGFMITDVRVSETDRLTSARLCAFVNGQILQQVVLEISIVPGGTATVNEDYHTTDGLLTFNRNANNPQCEFYTILGDMLDEDDETILFQLSSRTGGVSLIAGRSNAQVTILNDDSLPDERGVIVLIENTPAVTLEAGGITASVTVRFTLSPEAASATCALQELRQGAECTSGSIVFSGLPAFRDDPFILEIVARDQFGQQLVSISRPVRLGFGGDCAVNFVNGVEQAQVFQGVVFVEFSRIGQVTSTDCRLDDGPFARCVSPVQFEGLQPGPHEVKVRPNGENCDRRIRRTATFTVV